MQTVLGICTILGGLAALVFFYDRYKASKNITSFSQDFGRIQGLRMLAGGLGGLIPGLVYFWAGHRAGFTVCWIATIVLFVFGVLLSIFVGETARSMLVVGSLLNLALSCVGFILSVAEWAGVWHLDLGDLSFSGATMAVFLTITGLIWGYAMRDFRG